MDVYIPSNCYWLYHFQKILRAIFLVDIRRHGGDGSVDAWCCSVPFHPRKHSRLDPNGLNNGWISYLSTFKVFIHPLTVWVFSLGNEFI
jgi:hypothetical protein